MQSIRIVMEFLPSSWLKSCMRICLASGICMSSEGYCTGCYSLHPLGASGVSVPFYHVCFHTNCYCKEQNMNIKKKNNGEVKVFFKARDPVWWRRCWRTEADAGG
ncbi:hypothetical protein XENTR_v10005173 [Xenopus tropicalis]|nr:hypothetical protein XENTR_v10005173 [Xenopus tropicalis]